MTRWVSVGLVLLVGIAGCSGIPVFDPPPQDEPAPVKLVNNASVTERFEVAVVRLGEGVSVTREDGDTFNKTVGEGSSTLITSSENKFVSITFPDSARVHGQYTLEPGESKLLHIGNVAPDQAIVILVYDKPEETYRAVKSLNCGGAAILGYKVSPESGGSEDWTPSAFQCG